MLTSRTAITVVMNPSAGGSATPAAVDEAFRAAGRPAHVRTFTPGEDLTALAASLAAPDAVIVAAGGDGTVSAVAGGVAGTGAVLGVLPVGTLNHFAKDAGVPLALTDAVATVLHGRVARADVGAVNGRVFVNACSLGAYPNAVAIRERLRERGWRKWLAMAAGSARVLRDYRGVHVRLADAHGGATRQRTPFLFIANNAYTIDGLQLGGRSRLDGGELVAYLAPHARTRDLPLLFARGLLGRARQSGAFMIVPARELWVDTPLTKARLALDGELVDLAPPLHFTIHPAALPLLVPAEAP